MALLEGLSAETLFPVTKKQQQKNMAAQFWFAKLHLNNPKDFRNTLLYIKVF